MSSVPRHASSFSVSPLQTERFPYEVPRVMQGASRGNHIPGRDSGSCCLASLLLLVFVFVVVAMFLWVEVRLVAVCPPTALTLVVAGIALA